MKPLQASSYIYLYYRVAFISLLHECVSSSVFLKPEVEMTSQLSVQDNTPTVTELPDQEDQGSLAVFWIASRLENSFHTPPNIPHTLSKLPQV